jgi:hypothetical protein
MHGGRQNPANQRDDARDHDLTHDFVVGEWRDGQDDRYRSHDGGEARGSLMRDTSERRKRSWPLTHRSIAANTTACSQTASRTATAARPTLTTQFGSQETRKSKDKRVWLTPSMRARDAGNQGRVYLTKCDGKGCRPHWSWCVSAWELLRACRRAVGPPRLSESDCVRDRQ